MTAQLTGKLYMNHEDALRYTGVTAKQLRDWREEGLIELELGSRAGRELKFTERDLTLLAVIKKLRDEGYPTSLIKKMLTARGSTGFDFSANYWDYDQDQWITQLRVAYQALATEGMKNVERLVEMALVAYLWRSARDGASVTVRHTRVQEIVGRVLEADRPPEEQAPPCVYSTLEARSVLFVQEVLRGEAKKRIRADPDHLRLLEELNKYVGWLHEVVPCEGGCGRHLVREFVENDPSAFCSPECENEFFEELSAAEEPSQSSGSAPAEE